MSIRGGCICYRPRPVVRIHSSSRLQIARFGASTAGMPPPWVYRGSDGALVLYNGVTRATRVAKLASGTLIRVEVVGDLKRPVGHYPKIGDTLP